MTGNGNPLTQLAINQVDAGQPGVLTLTLAEHLRCEKCHHTGPRWQVVLGASTAPPARTPRKNATEPGS